MNSLLWLIAHHCDPKLHVNYSRECGSLPSAGDVQVVADSCQDGNFWCRNDRFHLDLQRDLVEDFCGAGSDITCFNSRRISWKLLDGRPPASAGFDLYSDIRFHWFCSSNFPWYSSLIIHNLDNGVSRVVVNGLDADIANGVCSLPCALAYIQEQCKLSHAINLRGEAKSVVTSGVVSVTQAPD